MYKLTSDLFLEIDITPEMLASAEKKAQDIGKLNNSIRGGQGNLVGCLGEEIVLAAWGGSKSRNTYQHDIDFENITFEVKSKDRTVYPRLSYEASVANYNTKQKADFYVFTSVYRPDKTNKTLYTRGHVIGIIDKNEYYRLATALKKGDIDPSNGWQVSADCWNLKYERLTRFEGW